MKKIMSSRPLLKVLSFVMALTLWLYVQGDRKEEKMIVISIDLINRPEGLVVSHDYDPSISLRVSGPRAKIQRIKSDQIPHYKLDLSQGVRGLNTLWIHESDIKLPHGVRIQNMSPQVVRISLDEIRSKSVNVTPVFSGELPSGFQIKQVLVTPSTVDIRGPSQMIDQVTNLRTDPVSLSDVTQYTERKVSIEPLESSIQLATQVVNMQIHLSDEKAQKVLPNISVNVSGSDSKIESIPSRIEVTASGLGSQLTKIDASSVHLQLNAWDLETSRTWKELSIDACKFLQAPSGIDYTCKPQKVLLKRNSSNEVGDKK